MIKGSMNLAAFNYVIMEKKNKAGESFRGLFIPIELNRLEEHQSGGIYFNFIGFPMKTPKEWATHIIKQSLKKDVREAMSEEERNAMAIFGNINVTDFQAKGVDNNLANGEVFNPDSDDLPF